MSMLNSLIFLCSMKRLETGIDLVKTSNNGSSFFSVLSFEGMVLSQNCINSCSSLPF